MHTYLNAYELDFISKRSFHNSGKEKFLPVIGLRRQGCS